MSTGKRFIIDRRCDIYEKNFKEGITKDTSNPVITYRLTRSDSVLYDYQNSGHYEFLAYQDEQHEGDGYYLVNGKGYWLCQEVEVKDDDKPTLTSSIEYDTNSIYNGLEPGVFIAKFYDENGDVVDIKPNWNVNCDFSDQLEIEYVDNAIYISVNNKKLINKSFELLLSADGYETKSINITIKSFI